jgi:predicted transcriptional regulator YheO
MNQVDVNEQPSNNAGAQVLNLQQVSEDDPEMLNTSVAPEADLLNAQALNIGNDDGDLSELSVGKNESTNQELQSIARTSVSGENIRQISDDGIRRVDPDTEVPESSKHSIQDRLNAKHALNVRARLPKDGIFHLKNGISELAGADLRGADLSRFRDGIAYKIEVPLSGGKTEILALGDWLARATPDEIKALVPGMVFQGVESDEFKVTNFGGKDNNAIIKKLSSKKVSKAYDYSEIDINKDFSGHQGIDLDEPFYEDKWAANPDKVDLLTPKEHRHKKVIQARCILDDYVKMDAYVKEKMADADAVNNAMGQMIEELVKKGETNPAFARMGEESEGAHRERLRKEVFNSDEKIAHRLEAFFRRSYIAEQQELPQVKDAVNKRYDSFDSHNARTESLREEGGRVVEVDDNKKT